MGAGAALKRLHLTRVRDVGVTGCPTVTPGEPLPQVLDRLRADATDEVLLLDRNGRPSRWLRRDDLLRAKGSLARAGTPVRTTVTGDATLRDALEAVLTDNTGRVAVTGRHGEYTGVVDMETLLGSVRGLMEADRLDALERHHRLEETRTGRKPSERTPADGESDGGEGAP